MILTSEKWLLLLLYILLMQGCTCVPVPRFFSSEEAPSADFIVAPPGVPNESTAPPQAKAETNSSNEPGPSPGTLGEHTTAPTEPPCLSKGKNKFGIRYYYRPEKDNTGFFKRFKKRETKEKEGETKEEETLALARGDEYLIKFALEAECYVYVYQVEDDSRITDLVKLSGWSHDKPFKGKGYSLPSNEDAPFQLKEANGQKVTIYFLASKERNQNLEDQYDTFSKDYEKQKSDPSFKPQERLKPLLEGLKKKSEALKELGTVLNFSVNSPN